MNTHVSGEGFDHFHLRSVVKAMLGYPMNDLDRIPFVPFPKRLIELIRIKGGSICVIFLPPISH
jgi:hypothetical protein